MSEITELEIIFEKLVEIKNYLIKVGPTRRQYSEAAQQKFNENLQLYSRLESISSSVRAKIEEGFFQDEDIRTVNQLIGDIQQIYRYILSLCVTATEEVGHPKSVHKQTETSKMASENFDIKTAIALLPFMTGQEQVTNQLIDSIQLYSSMLNDAARKQFHTLTPNIYFILFLVFVVIAAT